MPEPLSQVTVDGTPYIIFDRHALDDGRTVSYGLKSVGGAPQTGQAATSAWGRKAFNEAPDGARTVFTLPYRGVSLRTAFSPAILWGVTTNLTAPKIRWLRNMNNSLNIF